MYYVCWIGYHTGVPVRERVYGQHHAESYAAALRANGIPNVTVEGPFPFTPTPYVLVARLRFTA